MENFNSEMELASKLLVEAAHIIKQNSDSLEKRILALEQEVQLLKEQIAALQHQQPLQEQSAIDFDQEPEAEQTPGVPEEPEWSVEPQVQEMPQMSVEPDVEEMPVELEVQQRPVEPEIPHSMAGMGILAFAEELSEKANEVVPGSEVFDMIQELEPELEPELEEESLQEELKRDGMIVNEAAKPDWYDWEVDYPAEYVSDVYKAISFNDRYVFVRELFNLSDDLSEAENLFKEVLDDVNGMDTFKQVVSYMRMRFPKWDEQSDEVYRFYMAVRRKFNKQ